jgi:hypothetical protein
VGARAQETIVGWDWDETNWVATHAKQQGPPRFTQVDIPLDRCLHFRVRPRKQNPQGSSLLRSCYDAWYFTKHISRLEAIGIERDFVGIPKIGVPRAVYDDAALVAPWVEIATNMTKDEVTSVILPTEVDPETKTPLYSFDLVSSAGTRLIDTDKVLNRYERKILRSMLAAFLTLGDTGVGSFALGTALSDLFVQAAKALLEGIQDTINGAVVRLCALNGIGIELVPTFVFNEVGSRDVKAFADTLLVLITAGIVDPADPDLKEHVYLALGLPMPQDAAVLPVEKPRIPAEPVAQPPGAPLPVKQPKADGPVPVAATAKRWPLWNGSEGGRTANGPQTPARRFVEPSELDAAIARFDKAAATIDPALVGLLNAEVA